MMLMFHDDSCGELLNAEGECPKCKFSPDMQSTGFREVDGSEMIVKREGGATFMGLHRAPVR